MYQDLYLLLLRNIQQSQTFYDTDTIIISMYGLGNWGSASFSNPFKVTWAEHAQAWVLS